MFVILKDIFYFYKKSDHYQTLIKKYGEDYELEVNENNYLRLNKMNKDNFYQVINICEYWNFHDLFYYSFVLLFLLENTDYIEIFLKLKTEKNLKHTECLEKILREKNMINALIKYGIFKMLDLAFEFGHSYDSETGLYLIKHAKIENISHMYSKGFRFNWYDFEMSFFFEGTDVINFMFINNCEYKETLFLAAFSANNKYAINYISKTMGLEKFSHTLINYCCECYPTMLKSGARLSSSFKNSPCLKNCCRKINGFTTSTLNGLETKIEEILKKHYPDLVEVMKAQIK